MIGWREAPSHDDEAQPLGFDDFDLRLGDVMRGERATLGKSLLDVQRELKIKATFIAAIENADLSAFESPGFVAGYVRSYARYLGLDPEWAFATFCAESGFTPMSVAQQPGMPRAAPERGPVFRKRKPAVAAEGERDPIVQPRVSFVPETKGPLASVEPRAIGSTLVLLGLIAAIGYGAWTVLKEVQRVTVTPVEQAPEAIAQVDPLEGLVPDDGATPPVAGGASAAALERLYRPQALDAPVMVARDGPIAAIDPARMGALAGPDPLPGSGREADLPAPRTQGDGLSAAIASAMATVPGGAGAARTAMDDDAGDTDARPVASTGTDAGPRVTEAVPEVLLVAVRPAWVRVRAADGTVLLERTMQPGDSWTVPVAEAPAQLRTGAAGGVFFAVNGETYGPAGAPGEVVDRIALSPPDLTQSFARVDPEAGGDAREAVRVAQAALGAQAPAE